MNKRLQEQVDNVLNRLSVPITILDADSDRLPDGMPLSTLRLTEGEARTMLGSLYMAVPPLHIVLTCAEQQPGARDVLQLAAIASVWDELLMLFSLYNIGLFAAVTAISFAVFAALYAVVYRQTAGAYYAIVSGGRDE